MAGRISARSHARLAALGMALSALVAGCGDSEESDGTANPAATTSVTETATESPTDTPTTEPSGTSALPPLPEEATQNTPEGAEAFIRYYFDFANDLYQNPPPVEEIGDIVGPDLVDPECISCQTLRTELSQLSENGQRTLGDLYTVDSIERIGGGPPDVQRFNLVMTLNDYVIEDSEGEQFEYSGNQVEGVGAATWTGEQWVIYGMELN